MESRGPYGLAVLMSTHTLAPTRTRTTLPLIGAALFLLLYLAVSPVAGAVRSGELPLPGSAPDVVHAHLAANTTASLLTGALQGVSGLGLALAVVALSRTASIRLTTLGRVAGWVAVAAILTSAVLSVVLGFIARTVDTELVATVRDVSFHAGGVLHVVSLGVLVLSIAMTRGWSRPVRIVGWIAGTLAVLSLLSIMVYYASLFLPLGRLACMLALVVTGISILRRQRDTAPNSAVAAGGQTFENRGTA